MDQAKCEKCSHNLHTTPLTLYLCTSSTLTSSHPHILTPSHPHTLTSSHIHTITGILCGECRQSYGVGMLVMQCREFNARFPMYYWLLPLLGMWKLGAWPHYHRYYIPVEDGHVHTAGSSPSWVWRGVARGQITHRYIDDGICCDNYDNRIDWFLLFLRSLPHYGCLLGPGEGRRSPGTNGFMPFPITKGYISSGAECMWWGREILVSWWG